ncbi:MAG: hypothetical protein HGA77_04810 [Chlorobiaceae bacterium]|nr:hypothetical protein [Chlorobiaceae bacterium]
MPEKKSEDNNTSKSNFFKKIITSELKKALFLFVFVVTTSLSVWGLYYLFFEENRPKINLPIPLPIPLHIPVEIILVSFVISIIFYSALLFVREVNGGNFKFHEEDDLAFAEKIIKKRNSALKSIGRDFNNTDNADVSGLKEKEMFLLTEEQMFSLSITDLFVEKAQAVLSRRGNFLIRAGAFTVFSAIMLLIFGFFVAIFSQPLLDILQKYINSELKINIKFDSVQTALLGNKRSDGPWVLLLYYLIKTLGITAYIYICVKLLLSLARSFFHEGLSLFERRHALRFGRMYIYLKKGNVSEKWLERFFQWNKETKTSFLDMKPEVLTETLMHKLFGVFPDIIQSLKNKSN